MANPRRSTNQKVALNKRKQTALRLAGYNIKVDGSWGPWQEAQYRKISTHKKEYSADPLGLLTYLKDKVTGNTTYYKEPSVVTGYTGEVRKDTRNKAQKIVDNQLHNNKTPLGYLYRTVLPTAAVSVGLVYGGAALGGLARGAVKAAPAAARAASATGKAVGQGARKVAAHLMTSGSPAAAVQTTSGTMAVPVASQAPGVNAWIPLLGTAALGTSAALQSRRTPIPISRPLSMATEATTDSVVTTPRDSITPQEAPQSTSSQETPPQNNNQNQNQGATQGQNQEQTPQQKPQQKPNKNRFKEGAKKVGKNLGSFYGKVLTGGAYVLGGAGIPAGVGYGVYRLTRPAPTATDSLLEEQNRQIMELGKLKTAKQNQMKIDSLRRSLTDHTNTSVPVSTTYGRPQNAQDTLSISSGDLHRTLNRSIQMSDSIQNISDGI